VRDVVVVADERAASRFAHGRSIGVAGPRRETSPDEGGRRRAFGRCGVSCFI